MPPRQKSSKARSKPSARQLRGEIWIEADGKPALTEAGADLLDQIDVCGSLSEAARQLRYSYRRAWMLLDAMNHRWSKPLVATEVGGERGGGARLTDLGKVVLRSYRDLQLQLEHLLDDQADAFQAAVNSVK